MLMIPRKARGDLEDQKTGFARRLREVRVEIYGESGAPALAEVMDVPCQTWKNYEAGVAMPALIALRFLEATALSPEWLLSGDGPRYRVRHPAFQPHGLN
jgi:hypothetical protein